MTLTETSDTTEVIPTEKVQVDYFGVDTVFTVQLPDGKSFIQHKLLNEGDRRRYLNQTNREITLERTTQNAIMKMAAGDEKHMLLKSAICGWNLVRGDEPVAFSKAILDKFLESADPRIIDLIEADIRRKNPWLQGDMPLDEIDKEIERLQELRAIKVEEEEGNVGSATK